MKDESLNKLKDRLILSYEKLVKVLYKEIKLRKKFAKDQDRMIEEYLINKIGRYKNGNRIA